MSTFDTAKNGSEGVKGKVGRQLVSEYGGIL